jgi:hypothetical protein
LHGFAAVAVSVRWIAVIRYARWSSQEVVELLQGLLDGSYDDHQWDNFVSMKIEDAALEYAPCVRIVAASIAL